MPAAVPVGAVGQVAHDLADDQGTRSCQAEGDGEGDYKACVRVGLLPVVAGLGVADRGDGSAVG